VSLSLKISPPHARRLRVRVRGAIQGVGFRPFIDRLARQNALSGWVRNDAEGVLIEIEGERTGEFLDGLRPAAPQLARIARVDVAEIRPIGSAGFEIRESGGGAIQTLLPPDQPVCCDCLEELFDPHDRRHLYPFINCTNCGPRFTLVRRLPYDRQNTSMADFPLCARCATEYADPRDRRFHAEATACPACGPRLDHPIDAIVARVAAGEIVAIKGIGGFQLVCDARSERAVARLRRRKDRDEKPFALMAANVASIRRWARCDAREAALLASAMHPIVVLQGRTSELAAGIAPGLRSLGFMLPTAPIHHLIFHAAAGSPSGVDWLDAPQDLVLVMTSANPGGEPLVTDDREAERRLAGIADFIVGHDREIVTRADDSVVRILAGAPAFIRRARGCVPEPIQLARALPPILAVGAQLKNTVCVIRDDEAFVSQHVGTLDHPESIRFFEETIDHLLQLLDVEPECVAHDLHPDFASTRYALACGLPTRPIQHHLAHVAAVAAEHRITEAVLGLALDGFGLGPNAASWGGELLWVDGARWRRLGHLQELLQPGGDVAATQPWRMGAAALYALGREDEIAVRLAHEAGSAHIAQLLCKRINSPPTSSCGRLFDAACGLLNVVPRASFEGQAPMVLEALVDSPSVLDGGFTLCDGVLDLRPLLAHLVDCSPRAGAEVFHGTLIAALGAWVGWAAAQTGIPRVVLSGGCLLNRVLAIGLVRELDRAGIEALLPIQLPPNDGAVSLGQAWVAGLLDAGEDPEADGAMPCA